MSNENHTFTGNVTILDKTEFVRKNIHTNTNELFVAITMQARYNRILVCYTRWDTVFAKETEVGQKVKISANLTEARDDRYGWHWKATFCKIGGYSTPTAQEQQAKRKAKMMKKLGLA